MNVKKVLKFIKSGFSIYDPCCQRLADNIEALHQYRDPLVQVAGLSSLPRVSDVKFHEFFGVKYFMKYFVKYFWNISKISRWTIGVGCIVHCNKVSKPVKGKYLLLCMNSIMYFLLSSYTLIMFLKVLSHFIMQIKISWNIFQWRGPEIMKYFKISMKFSNISKRNI